jgi:hypothetical protein
LFYNTRTDSSGVFRCLGLPTGSFTACVKHFRTLKNCRPVEIDPGENEIDFGTLLEGDANNDNSVELRDFSILQSSFGTCAGNLRYDQRADFTNDGCVNALDFSLLSANFGKIGFEPAALAHPSALRHGRVQSVEEVYVQTPRRFTD